jgi:hypothetical protein
MNNTFVYRAGSDELVTFLLTQYVVTPLNAGQVNATPHPSDGAKADAVSVAGPAAVGVVVPVTVLSDGDGGGGGR